MRNRVAASLFLASCAAAVAWTQTSGGAAPQKSSARKAAAPARAPFNAALLHPAKLTAQAPAVYQARFVTTRGEFVIKVTREWSPQGADRFYNLVRNGFYDGAAFFRVVSGFMAQVGISAHPQVSAAWREARIPDDPVKASNKRGFVTFAKTNAPHSRTTQIFFNYGDNARLDSMGFSPFGEVLTGMEVLDALYAGYGDGAPFGMGPDQGRIQAEGKAYLEASFPKLDTIKSATIVAPAPASASPAKKAPAKKAGA
jgi:peptidyl-prolyl cis-trans isomerase A (cyclophilin A)